MNLLNPLSLIPAGLQVWVRIAALLLVVGLVFGAGWKVKGAMDSQAIAEVRVQHANLVADATSRNLAAQKKADAEHEALAGKLAAADSRYHEDLTRSLHENDTLRASVAAGARLVRVAGTCAQRTGDVPQAAAGGQLDPGAGAELDAAGGQAVLDLRAGAIRFDKKLAACQQTVNCLTGQGACPAAGAAP